MRCLPQLHVQHLVSLRVDLVWETWLAYHWLMNVEGIVRAFLMALPPIDPQ